MIPLVSFVVRGDITMYQAWFIPYMELSCRIPDAADPGY